MRPKITKGSNAHKLMTYLSGPGFGNEHTNPHLVAGDAGIVAFYGGELDRPKAIRVASYVDRPFQRFEGTRGRSQYARTRVSERDPSGVATAVKVETKVANHVWQCSLSVRAAEGQLGEETWSKIAERFVEKMGLVSREQIDGALPATDSKWTVPYTRWGAVHHGLSANGNDHIHVVVGLVREDGTRVATDNDYRRAQQVTRELEAEFGLLPTNPNEYEWARANARSAWETERAEHPGARIPWDELTTDLQDVEAERLYLEHHSTEEWAEVYATRAEHAEKTAPEVPWQRGEREEWNRHTGASDIAPIAAENVATRAFEEGKLDKPWSLFTPAEQAAAIRRQTPQEQPRAILARTIRAAAVGSTTEAEFLTALREKGVIVRPRWEQGGTREVVGWSVAFADRPGGRSTSKGWYSPFRDLGKDLSLPKLREGWDNTPENRADAARLWAGEKAPKQQAPRVDAQRIAEDLRTARDQLATVPIGDRQEWIWAARRTAGMYSAAAASAAFTAREQRLFATAAETLTRSCRVPITDEPAAVPMPSAAGTLYLSMAATKSDKAGALAIIQAMDGLAKAIADMHRAEQAMWRAERLEADTRAVLERVTAGVGERVASTSTGPAWGGQKVQAWGKGKAPAPTTPPPGRRAVEQETEGRDSGPEL